MTSLVYLLAFIFVLSLVVIIHEGGHFVVARLCGVKVTEFSLGFGKKLFSKEDKKGTAWQIRAVPLGGYVKMLGDGDAASATSSEEEIPEEDKDKTFISKPLSKRAAIIFAGPAMNYVLAFFILFGLFWGVGEVIVKPVVGSVLPDSAAEVAGIMPKDEIVSINKMPIESFSDIQRKVLLTNYGQKLDMIIKREGKLISIGLTPRMNAESDRPLIGITAAGETVVINEHLSFLESAGKAFQTIYESTRDTLIYLGQVITGRRTPKDMRGPLGIAEASGDALLAGFVSLMAFVAQVSIAVGLMNLLPIPVLDGGHLFLYAIEAIRRKPLTEKTQTLTMWAGVCVLMVIFAYTMILDIPRIAKRMISEDKIDEDAQVFSTADDR